jgi:translocation and assembly module TamB
LTRAHVVVLRGCRAVLHGLALSLLVVVAIVASLLVHLDTPVVRRVAIARVNQLVFKPLFRGEFVITALGHLDPFGVRGASVRVNDPTGQPLLVAEGIDGRFSTLALLESALRDNGDLIVDIPRVSIRQVDIRLDMDEDAGMAFANAFFPRTPSTEPPLPYDGHGVHVYAPRVHIDHAWGHGQLLTLPYLDGDVTGLDAAFALRPSGLSVEARKGSVVARGIARGADAKGAFDGVFDMTLNGPPVLGGRAHWDGTVGTLRETANAKLEKEHFDAAVDVPDAPAEAIRSVWPDSPIAGTANAHLEAHGPLSAIELAVHAGLDEGTLDVHGQLGWGPPKQLSVHIDAGGIDLRKLAPTAPPSSLGMTGDVRLSRTPDGRLDGEAELDFAQGKVASIATPRATLRTKGFHEATGAFGGDATIVVDEPGAPTTLTLHAVPTAESSKVEFDLVSHDVRLGAVRSLSANLTGNARLVGKGNLNLDNLALDATVGTEGRTLTRGPLTVAAIGLKGRAHGKLFDPQVDADLHAEGVQWKTLTLSTLDVSVHGPALMPHVTVHEQSTDVPNLDAELDVAVLEGALHHVDARLTREGESARVRADTVRFAREAIAVEGIEVEGLGAPARASFDLVGDTLRLRAAAPRLEALRVAKLLGIQDTVRGGTLAIDADVSLEPTRASGRGRVELEGGTVGPFEALSARIDGELTDRRFVGKASAHVGELGFIEIDATKLGVGGTDPLARVSWKKLWGDVLLKGHVDLAKLAADFPTADLPFGTIRGGVDLDGHLERDSASDFTPLIDLTVKTSGLVVSGKTRPSEPANAHATRPAPWMLQGVDATTSVHVNGETGFLTVNTHLVNAQGDLAIVDAESPAIPYEALYESPSNALTLLGGIPFDARVAMPAQSLDTWPTIVHVPVDGTLKADVTVRGPLRTPQIKLAAKLTDMTSMATRLTSPVELDLDASYDGGHLDTEVHGVRDGREVLTAEAHASLRAEDLVSGRDDLPWDASAKVHVEAFPLMTIGPLDDRQIRGNVSGDVVLEGLHKDASAHAALDVTNLRVGDALYPDAHATFAADGKTLDAEARLDQTDGTGSLKASVAATWGVALFPTPDPHQTLDLSFFAKHFRAAFLLPFVQGPVDELDGFVDGSMKATVDPVTENVRVEGALALTHGLFELASFGGELHDVAAKVTVTPAGLLTVEGFTASGVSGQVLASASARLNGLRLEGASATLQIPKSRPFPLSVNGSLLGSVDGKLNVTESMSADRHTLDIKADIPTLHVVLPETGSQDVQALGPIPGVEVGTRATPGGTFVVDPATVTFDTAASTKTRAADAIQVRVETHFGNDVVIRRGNDLRVELTGGPVVTVAETTRVSGQIQLRGGVLNLYGKTFDIETGTVTFVGDDASNPQVRVTAGWSAPEGTQVYADFIGPLKTGKVTLRSEPPLGRNDIVQLLLFGTTNGEVANATAAAPPGAYSAGGVAGNIATQPLNRALDQFGLSAVSAKVDTSSANAKPEVEVQIAKTVSVQLAHVLYLGPPPPGTAPDTTLLTLDWRFLRKWSLEATVGNAGSTIVDLVWQYRY